MNNEDADMESVITTFKFNTAVTVTACDSVRSVANIIRRKNPGLLQKFLIRVTKGEKERHKNVTG